ncbi:MAG: T9SS type A sorting domain-containing protein [Ginsengibacter sp.]
MYKLPAAFFLLFLGLGFNSFATIALTAIADEASSQVMVRWNMVNYPANTAYTLFKSEDGVIWNAAAANPAFRNYTSATILAYQDNFNDEQKLYYRVKIYDTNENIVEISNTAIVENPKNPTHIKSHAVHLKSFTGNNETPPANGRSWQIVPNPVRDMLNILYTGNQLLKGVINIIVQDGTGTAVIRFRAASNNKQLHIPVSNLRPGIYFIKIAVNEMQLNDKFVKQ